MADSPRSLPRPADERPWGRQRLHVPRADETLYARPAWNEAAELVERNRDLFAGTDPNLQGRTLGRLRAWARRAVLDAARDYTAAIRGDCVAAVDDVDRPIVVGGHQPALFHPGVWAKNFAVGGLAARIAGVGLHLIVDNDTLSSKRIPVPAGTREAPSLELLPVDLDEPLQPWEEARVIDRALFDSFGDRAAAALARWGVEPLAGTVWPDALAGAEGTGMVRDAFTAVRHRLEARWGLDNLELPLSRVETLDPFLWFAGHLLAHLPRFREIHNEILGEYRRLNRVRSRTHPVADLKVADGWHEAPFWVWKAGDRVRGRVLAKQVGRQVLLSDGGEEFARLRLAPDMDACCAVEGLRELADRGIRFRTRALTTTLFARLCLADAFIHGIGGAKYDEMTDRLFTRFYGIGAPEFVTISATLHLPIGPPFDVTADDERRLAGLLRDLEWNSERHLTRGIDPAVDALIEEHDRLVAEESHRFEEDGLPRRAVHATRRSRFLRFQDVSRRLAERTGDQQERVEGELAVVRSQRTANAVLENREFSFVLYPEEKVRPFLAHVR